MSEANSRGLLCGGNYVDEPPSVSANNAAYGPRPPRRDLATASGGAAQELQDLKKPATPLVLQSQGSFTVGGDIVISDALGAGGSGHIAVQRPHRGQPDVPAATSVERAITNSLELTSKLLGMIVGRTSTTNILISSDYLQLRGAIVAALKPFPEASRAVGTALAELELEAAADIASSEKPLLLEASPC